MRALDAKRVRRERRLVVAEGEDLVDAALANGLRPRVLLVDAERVGPGDPRLAATADLDERYAVPGPMLAGVSRLAAHPRVIGVFEQPGPHHFSSVRFPPSLALYLAGVADPGNVGTLVRTAAAVGCDWVALGPGSADAANPKAVRAGMGATFAVPILEGVAPGDLAARSGFQVVAAEVRGGPPPWEVDLTRPTVLVMGAERAGLSGALEGLAGAPEVVPVTIPQHPGAESMNVAAAGAAILVEALRQRAAAGTAPIGEAGGRL